MSVLGAVVGLAAAGAGGAVTPTLVRRLPEPPAKAPSTEAAEAIAAPDSPTATVDPEAVAAPEQPTQTALAPARAWLGEEPETKELYATIAGHRWFAPSMVAVSAAIGAGLGWVHGLSPVLFWLVPLTPVLVALAIIDWRTKLLPTRLITPSVLATLAVVTAVAFAVGEPAGALRAVIAMAAVWLFYFILWWFHGAGIGYGDVRLGGLLGAAMGWFGGGAVAVGMMTSFIAFVIPPVLVAIVKMDRSILKIALPFGPAMIAGAFIAFLWGQELAQRIWG